MDDSFEVGPSTEFDADDNFSDSLFVSSSEGSPYYRCNDIFLLDPLDLIPPLSGSAPKPGVKQHLISVTASPKSILYTACTSRGNFEIRLYLINTGTWRCSHCDIDADSSLEIRRHLEDDENTLQDLFRANSTYKLTKEINSKDEGFLRYTGLWDRSLVFEARRSGASRKNFTKRGPGIHWHIIGNNGRKFETLLKVKSYLLRRTTLSDYFSRQEINPAQATSNTLIRDTGDHYAGPELATSSIHGLDYPSNLSMDDPDSDPRLFCSPPASRSSSVLDPRAATVSSSAPAEPAANDTCPRSIPGPVPQSFGSAPASRSASVLDPCAAAVSSRVPAEIPTNNAGSGFISLLSPPEPGSNTAGTPISTPREESTSYANEPALGFQPLDTTYTPTRKKQRSNEVWDFFEYQGHQLGSFSIAKKWFCPMLGCAVTATTKDEIRTHLKGTRGNVGLSHTLDKVARAIRDDYETSLAQPVRKKRKVMREVSNLGAMV
jgi:hypothetical protein